MERSSDYKDLFSILNIYRVKYMVVGAYKEVCPEDFTDENMVFQIGIAPIRVDIMSKKKTKRLQDRLDLEKLLKKVSR